MKTTRSNSFRLHRISKTNSLKKAHDSTFIHAQDVPFKLEAIHSINKGVKYNDLSFITGRDHLNKLRKEPTSQTDIALESAHINLNDMRKKYDEVKKKSLYMEESIDRLKEEKEKYELKQNDFNGGKNKGKEKVQNMQKDLEEKKVLLDSTQTEKKVLLSLISRHKTDRIFFDQKKFNLEQEYTHLKKQLKIFLKEGTEIGENKDRTTKVYEKFLKQLETQKKQRDGHLDNVESLLMSKASILEANQTRGIQIQQIAQRAMLDKNLNQKQWEKIFLAHTFLNKMLRNKIEREMEKFRIVQFAFKEIKTATGVNDAQVLVSKYLNKEEVYGELLSKISQNEKRIQELKGETDSQLAEQKNLQTQKQILQNTKLSHADLHDVIKELQFYQDKQKTCELLRTKLINWLQRQIKKFQLLDKKTQLPKDNKNLLSLFKIYSQKLSDSLIKADQVQISSIPNIGLGVESDKLVRINPKKSRINSKGEEIFDVDQQETNASNMAQQLEVVSTQRQEVLRTNQKFMKEMKKKREEMKVLLIEAMQKAQKEKEKPKVQIKKDE